MSAGSPKLLRVTGLLLPGGWALLLAGCGYTAGSGLHERGVHTVHVRAVAADTWRQRLEAELGAAVARELAVSSDLLPADGASADAVPWIVLAGGILLAVLLVVLTEVLTRRRAYALNLVEQRTRAMHQAQLVAEAANQSKSGGHGPRPG